MSRHLVSILATAVVLAWSLAAVPAAAQEEAQPRVVPERAARAPEPSPARMAPAAVPRAPEAVAPHAASAPAMSGEPQARPRGGNRGQAVGRTPRPTAGGEGSSGGQAVRRAPPTSGGSRDDGQAVRRGAPRGTSRGDGPRDRVVDRYSRPRTDQRVTGYAVPRRGVVYGRTPYYYGRSPWYYSPYGFGWSLGYFYNPYWWGNVYYPPYPTHGYVSYYDDTGAVRLKVKPREAQVFVDGYYVGIVDEFDGRFQRLRLDEGPQRIEIRLEGHEPLVFEVRVLRNRTLNLTGTLRPIGLP